jgi:hypothetical protein
MRLKVFVGLLFVISYSCACSHQSSRSVREEQPRGSFINTEEFAVFDAVVEGQFPWKGSCRKALLDIHSGGSGLDKPELVAGGPPGVPPKRAAVSEQAFQNYRAVNSEPQPHVVLPPEFNAAFLLVDRNELSKKLFPDSCRDFVKKDDSCGWTAY